MGFSGQDVWNLLDDKFNQGCVTIPTTIKNGGILERTVIKM